MQSSFQCAAVMDIAQAMHSRRQKGRTVVELRKKILQPCGIRLQIGEICFQIGVFQIRHSGDTYVTGQDRMIVIMQLDVLTAKRITCSTDSAIQHKRGTHSFHLGHKERYICRDDFRSAEVNRIGCFLHPLLLGHGRIGRDTHLYTAHVEMRLRQLRFERRQAEYRIVLYQPCAEILHHEGLDGRIGGLVYLQRQPTHLCIQRVGF